MSDGNPSEGLLLSWSAKEDTHFFVIAASFIADSRLRSKFQALFRSRNNRLKTMIYKKYTQG